MKIKTLVSLILFCILLIVSKEFLFLNEEVLVIISFLTFITLAIKVGGESMGEGLDKVNEEISAKVTAHQNKLLEELEATKTGVKGVETVRGELNLLIGYCLEEVEKLEGSLVDQNEQTNSYLIEEQISAEIDKQIDEEIARMADIVDETFAEYEEKV